MSEIPVETLLAWAKPKIGEPISLWRRLDHAVWLPEGVTTHGGPPWVVAKVMIFYDPATFAKLVADGWRPE